VAEKHVRQMNKMLSGVITRGTGKKARINRPAAGKTGTSQEFRDAWFVGYTGNLIAGVWLGNDNRSPMKRVSGGSLPAGLWKSVMIEAHEGLPQHPLLGLSDQYHSIAPRKSRENASFWGRILHNFTGR
jgi:penicillin-binding protein 1A